MTGVDWVLIVWVVCSFIYLIVEAIVNGKKEKGE